MGQPPLKESATGRDPAESELLAAIIRGSDDAIVGKTPDGVITSWNPAAERIYGYRAEEIIGQPMTVLCPPDRTGEIREILGKVGRGERVEHFETERRRKDGSTLPVSVSVSPIRDQHGVLIGASSIARDITEQRQARAGASLRRRAADLEQANGSLESFTYSVAHDLRAPLRSLAGFSQALIEDCGDDLGEVGRGYAERIQASSQRMAALIEDLLELSHVARAEIHIEPVDLSAEVARIAQDLQHGAPDRRVRFIIQDAVRAPGDRILIGSVLENLVGNAWKFTSRQDEALIEFGAAPAGDAGICYYVRDNGAGFDSAYAGKLFRPFERLHSAGDFPGTGVGLASVKQIVERHGGRAWAEGAIGQGATFYFTLDPKETT